MTASPAEQTETTEPGPACSCPVAPTEDLGRAVPSLDCLVHGMDLNTTQGIAALLRYGGVEIGSVGGEAFRLHVAERLRPLLRQYAYDVHAEAYRMGVADERTSVEATDGTVAPGRVNPYHEGRW